MRLSFLTSFMHCRAGTHGKRLTKRAQPAPQSLQAVHDTTRTPSQAWAGSTPAKGTRTTKTTTTTRQPTMGKRNLTRTQRGLGHSHDIIRKGLMARHKDGTPCWWCGKPMYRDKQSNWDHKPLAADHTKARAHGGTKADRLLHFTCNSQRQSGERDHLRPAALPNKPAFNWGE